MVVAAVVMAAVVMAAGAVVVVIATRRGSAAGHLPGSGVVLMTGVVMTDVGRRRPGAVDVRVGRARRPGRHRGSRPGGVVVMERGLHRAVDV